MNNDLKNGLQIGMKEAKEIANNEFAFRIFTINRIVKIEALMMTLVGGDGHKGRIPCMEDKVRWHDRIFWMVSGAIVLAGLLFQYGPQIVDWMRG